MFQIQKVKIYFKTIFSFSIVYTVTVVITFINTEISSNILPIFSQCLNNTLLTVILFLKKKFYSDSLTTVYFAARKMIEVSRDRENSFKRRYLKAVYKSI